MDVGVPEEDVWYVSAAEEELSRARKACLVHTWRRAAWIITVDDSIQKKAN